MNVAGQRLLGAAAASVAFVGGWALRGQREGAGAGAGGSGWAGGAGGGSAEQIVVAPSTDERAALNAEREGGRMGAGAGSPVARAAAYRAAADPLKRRGILLEALAGLTPQNAEQLRRELGIDRLDPNDPDFQDFHFAWGQVAGLDALLFGIDTPESDTGPTLQGWAVADPAAAVAWFQKIDIEDDPTFDPIVRGREIPADVLRAYLAHSLTEGLAAADPAAALDFAASYASGGGAGADGLVGVVAGRVVEARGVEPAKRWAESLAAVGEAVPFRRPDGKSEPVSQRAAAMASVAVAQARTDPRAAAEWVAASASPEDEPWVVRDVARIWAQSDPPGAVGWLETLGDSRGQREGLSAAYANWAAREPMGASEHLVAQPESPERDFAINGFTAALAHRDPESAVIWAEQITNPGLREAATLRAAQRFYAQDPAAASDWLATSGLSADSREKVLQQGGGAPAEN